jgi:hypothetical protein
MPRILFAFLLLVSCCYAAGGETKASRYVAKVNFLRVSEGKTLIEVNTEVTGTTGTPLKTVLGRKDGLILKLEMHDSPRSRDVPAMYVAHFKLVECKESKEIVLSHPALMTCVNNPAKLMVGQEHGDRLALDLIVQEIASTEKVQQVSPNRPIER